MLAEIIAPLCPSGMIDTAIRDRFVPAWNGIERVRGNIRSFPTQFAAAPSFIPKLHCICSRSISRSAIACNLRDREMNLGARRERVGSEDKDMTNAKLLGLSPVVASATVPIGAAKRVERTSVGIVLARH